MRTIAAAAIAASAVAIRLQLTLKDAGVEIPMSALNNLDVVEIEMPADETALNAAAAAKYREQTSFVDSVIQAGQPFTDQDFKPEVSSLYGPNEQISFLDKWGMDQLIWKRLTEIYPGGDLFQGDPFPKEVIQGDLGNCYLIAAMASVAVDADDIRGMFKYPELNPAGIYAVELYINGIKEIVVVDDWIPVTDLGDGTYKPAYAVATDEAYWVYLVEKAWSKLHGSYNATAGGNPAFAAQHLTGTATWTEDHNKTAAEV